MKADASKSVDVRAPRENVNDDEVKIIEWKVAEGTRVDKGTVLVEIETSKSVVEVESEAEGYLQILSGDGAEVDVGATIGRILARPPADASAPQSSSPLAAAADADAEAAKASSPSLVVSKKARQLIESHGIDEQVFAGRGLLRGEDVLDYLASRDAADAPPSDSEPIAGEIAAAGTSTAAGGATGVAATDASPEDEHPTAGPAKGLFGDAKSAAGDRGRSTMWVAWNYFYRNWLLGNLIRLAPRGIDLFLHRRRGVTIGRGCFVDPSATLETAYPENVVLGDDVRVAAGAIVMTHIKAPHHLREIGAVPVVLKPVRLEDHSFVGVNAVVMPGVTVGKASVVASGAVVFADVPPYTMVSGNPAQVVKRFNPTPGNSN